MKDAKGHGSESRGGLQYDAGQHPQPLIDEDRLRAAMTAAHAPLPSRLISQDAAAAAALAQGHPKSTGVPSQGDPNWRSVNLEVMRHMSNGRMDAAHAMLKDYMAKNPTTPENRPNEEKLQQSRDMSKAIIAKNDQRGRLSDSPLARLLRR